MLCIILRINIGVYTIEKKYRDLNKNESNHNVYDIIMLSFTIYAYNIINITCKNI